MKKVILAFQFLTIFPVKDVGEVSEGEMGNTTAVFPLIGFAEGIVLSLSATLFLKIFPTELTNALLVLLLAIMNGGLHLDGLSDTFDALASRVDQGKKLAIMKDSTVGPVGVLAIIMTVLLKYILLNAVYFHSPLSFYFVAVLIMPVLSRWAMVPAAYYSTPARGDGLGRAFIEHTGSKELITATVVTVALVLLVCGIGSQISLLIFYVMFSMPLLYAFSFGAVWFFNKYFGGMTGDSFGAVNELAVLVLLIMIVANNAKLP
jgi:adenosylcobinamide-GDP ribazoletransferase